MSHQTWQKQCLVSHQTLTAQQKMKLYSGLEIITKNNQKTHLFVIGCKDRKFWQKLVGKGSNFVSLLDIFWFFASYCGTLSKESSYGFGFHHLPFLQSCPFFG
jgi:hypothetical protein